MQAALLWLLLAVCMQDAVTEYVCSGLCPDGKRVLMTKEPQYKGIRMTTSECEMNVLMELANKCTALSPLKTFTYGPFPTFEAAWSFSVDVLEASETYYQNIGSLPPTTTPAPAPALPGIPAECRTGTRRETVDTSVAIDKAVGEATCSCHEFVKTNILVSISLNMIPSFLQCFVHIERRIS
jgi:hypothetical protein